MSRHEWTDRLGRHWCAIDGADLPPQGADFIVSQEVGEEILRLAGENATLRADQQAGIAALEAAGRQLLAEGADPGFWFDDHPPGADHWPGDIGRLVRQSARNERARIRRELLAEIIRETSSLGRGPSLGRRKLRSIIDRIVPEEG